jgi:hypothetical protein
MPTQDEHEEKARAIERLLPVLDEDQANHRDWLATISFYAGLHWLDAHLAQQGAHPSNHRERNRAAWGLPIWDEYYELYMMSRIARYEAGHLPQPATVRMRDQNLPTVRAWVQRSKQP